MTVGAAGVGQFGRPWTVTDNRWIVRETIAMFGAQRCMFANNFPVDRLCGSFATIFDGFREIVEDLPADAQALLFCGTAREVYRIG
jgi:predicted TIM-barrel fold metal-dependent hydrolase